jgi:hypothetical protein
MSDRPPANAAEVVRLFLGLNEVEANDWASILEGRIPLGASLEFIDATIEKLLELLRTFALERCQHLVNQADNDTINSLMILCTERLIGLSMLKVRRIAMLKAERKGDQP